jgi:hypothetical protein
MRRDCRKEAHHPVALVGVGVVTFIFKMMLRRDQ